MYNDNSLYTMYDLIWCYSAAPMDFTAFINRPLMFTAGSQMGDMVCTNIEIINDDVLESNMEEFFADITSSAADIELGRNPATITILETNDGSKRVAKMIEGLISVVM